MTETPDDTTAEPPTEDDQGKLSKKLVDYRGRDKAEINCGECKWRVDQREARATCVMMAGTVDPEHVCDLFEER